MSHSPSNWGAQGDILFPNGKLMAGLMYIQTGPTTYEAWDGSVSVEVTSSGSAIQDGVDPDIKATVLDFLGDSPTSVNPLSVILVDTDGEPYNASGGGGGGAVTIADGADVVEGELADAKVVGDNAGTISAKLRGLNYLLALVTDTVNNRLDVFIQNATLAVTQSGSWSVTANAGTNLNTSALALESGGNLAACATSLAILDDWDESDRAKVNLIAGQAGIAGGTGTDGANVPRVTLATNVALPAGTNNIGDVDVLTIPGIVGTIADDATTPGNPVMIGGFAKSPDGTDPGNVSAEDDVIRFIGDINRIQYVNTDDPTKKHVNFNGSSAYTDQQIAAAPGSGLRTVLTRIRVSNGAATALNMFVEEGSTKIAGPYYLPASIGGVVFDCFIPVTANTACTFTTSDAHAQTVEFEYITKKV